MQIIYITKRKTIRGPNGPLKVHERLKSPSWIFQPLL